MTQPMFRVTALYFREISVQRVQDSVSINTCRSLVYEELLVALESARTRLAIAIAAETKSTPLERWQYYLDTCYEMCRFIRELRRLETAASQKPQAWLRALEVLKKLPVQCEAMRFCRILRDVVEEFGRLEGA